MEVRVVRIGRSSITWGYRGYRAGDEGGLVVEGSNVTVCVEADAFKKIDVPGWLRQRLDGHLETSDPSSTN